MFAIIKSGGKQYKVEKGTTLKLEKLDLEEGKTLDFEEVLLVSDGETTQIGKPFLPKAKVKAKVVKNGRGKKIIIFKYKNKTRYNVKNGHRQHFTEVEITDIKA